VGLLEINRRAARPWTSAQIDDARVLAHSLGGAIQTDRVSEPSWSPALWAQQVPGRSG
jgi:hypothetical protein